MSPFYRLVRALILWLARVLFRLEHIGRQNIPPEGGCLLVSNHASNLDPPLVAVGVPRACHTLAKRELFDLPVLGWAIRRLYAHPIDRAGVDRRALKECIDTLKAGNVLLLFPEGTRTRNGELQPAKAGAAMIALLADVPIVPVYIDGTYEALPRGKTWPCLRKVRVYYGSPFRACEVLFHSVDKREAYDALAQEMMRRINQLRLAAIDLKA
ncbi:MAG: 1-acyl-sn-glycerol-3-phosphate acyltransferase [Candidatus Sumerlaeaceae bacterium]|nr:1-acyl-sn-glycerol-3-phosphate acyltransferase [Candidatus Sumerlaeaceae bacterium]